MRFGIPLTLVSLTINDEQRDREVRDDRATLYTSFRRYVEANPVYVPFASSFATHHGGVHIFDRMPTEMPTSSGYGRSSGATTRTISSASTTTSRPPRHRSGSPGGLSQRAELIAAPSTALMVSRFVYSMLTTITAPRSDSTHIRQAEHTEMPRRVRRRPDELSCDTRYLARS